MRGALADVDRVAIVRAAIAEGCTGETLAAARAAEASREAVDPVIREALAAVAEDEARHAALAWRFVAWAIETGSPLERQRISEELDLVAQGCSAALIPSLLSPLLSGHGFVVGQRAIALDESVAEQVVAPCARQLARRARGLEQAVRARRSHASRT